MSVWLPHAALIPIYWNRACPVRLPLPIIPGVNATAHRFGGFGFRLSPNLSTALKQVLVLNVGDKSFNISSSSLTANTHSWSTPSLGWAVGDTVAVSLKATIPNKPGNFSAEAGNGEVDLSWDDPSDTTITKYQYRQKAGSGSFSSWKDILKSAPGGTNALSFTVTSLTNDNPYTFKLRAVNGFDEGAATDEKTAQPAAAAQVNLWSATLTVGKRSGQNQFGYNGQFNYGSLSPTHFTHGGNRYNIPNFAYRTGDDLDLGFTPDIPFKRVLTLIVDDVEFSASDADSSFSGALYWSDHGLTWADGDTVSVSLKATLPGAPATFSATAGPVQAALPWDNPSDTAITKYQYRQKEEDGAFGTWKNIPGSGASTISHTVTGLTANTAHTFQVRAVNAAGAGAAAKAVTVTPFLPPLPAAPSGLTAGVGNTTIHLRWENPNNATITEYEVQQSTDGGANWAAWTTLVAGDNAATTRGQYVTGLAHGVAYTFQIRAVNDAGPGPVSDNTVTATLTPAKPVVTAEASDGQVTLSWPNPSDGTITGYQVQQSTDGGTTWDPAWTAIAGSDKDTTTHTVTGLTNGAAYTFQIRAMQCTVGRAERSDGNAQQQCGPACLGRPQQCRDHRLPVQAGRRHLERYHRQRAGRGQRALLHGVRPDQRGQVHLPDPGDAGRCRGRRVRHRDRDAAHEAGCAPECCGGARRRRQAMASRC